MSRVCRRGRGEKQRQRTEGTAEPTPPSLTHTGGGRVLKSALCVHDDAGLVVVKVRVCVCVESGRTCPVTVCFFPHFCHLLPQIYQKRGDAISLRPYEQAMLDAR